MMSVQRAEMRISDLFNIVPFVDERHPSFVCLCLVLHHSHNK